MKNKKKRSFNLTPETEKSIEKIRVTYGLQTKTAAVEFAVHCIAEMEPFYRQSGPVQEKNDVEE